MRILPTKECQLCGSDFSGNPRLAKKQWDKRRFCSRACGQKGQVYVPRKPKMLGDKRVCPSCRLPRELSQFYKEKSRPRTISYCKECLLKFANTRRRRIRSEVLQRYGGKCACCGESQAGFLAIDHVNNDGAQHRRETKYGNLPVWLRQNGYPSGFQILCHNCNLAKGFYGKCPHKLQDYFREV